MNTDGHESNESIYPCSFVFIRGHNCFTCPLALSDCTGCGSCLSESLPRRRNARSGARRTPRLWLVERLGEQPVEIERRKLRAARDLLERIAFVVMRGEIVARAAEPCQRRGIE